MKKLREEFNEELRREDLRVVRPEATIPGYLEKDLPVSAIANIRKSNSGKSINFDRPEAKDFSNGSFSMANASADQASGAWNWFVNEEGKGVDIGEECFINPPKMFGLKGGKGVYA